jgi:hypothetical protein
MGAHLATSLLLIAAIAPDGATDDPPDAIRGKAFLSHGDRSAAGVALQFFDRDAPRMTVVTDDGGRFRCAVPAGASLQVGRDGEGGPPCWMEAQDPGRWT